jgi:tungstate transport system substrate-binding protein
MKLRMVAGICLVAALAALVARVVRHSASVPEAEISSGHVRVAVIGGMVETGFWQAVAERFSESTHGRCTLDLVASGPKHVIADVFKRGEADLITMHASDTIINLVADGYAVDPQPWLKNDLVIVGPPADPAGIRGMPDAATALSQIVMAEAPFVVHASLGAQEVMRDVLRTRGIEMPSERLTMLFTDRARDVLKIAAENHAYTLVGRIPFRSGKLPNEGLEVMVVGDPLLRRPYVVAIANPRRFPDAHYVPAAHLAAFLRSEATQRWIADFGRGVLDDQPLFFRVDAEEPGSERIVAAEP